MRGAAEPKGAAAPVDCKDLSVRSSALGIVVGRTGIEPVTLGLKVPCSTN